MAQQLADGLAEAVAAAVAAAGVVEPFCLRVASSGARLPPSVLIGSREFRDSMRAASREDGAAVSELYSGVERGTVARVDLVDYCDRDTLAACHEVNTGLDHAAARPENDRATAVVNDLGPALAAVLLDCAWPGAAEPFLPLVDVHVYDPPEKPTVPEATRRFADPLRVEAFERSVASVRGRQRRPPSARKALTDRAALARHLSFHGLDADAERLAHEVATVGLLLEAGGSGRSRLGGPPLLPEGVGWPRTGDGRPLAFLAALDLADVGPLLGEPWPTAGLLLFYADIDPEYVDDLLTGALPGEASPARVFGTQAPVAASAPPTLTAFAHGERQVAPRAVLTLPDGFEAWRSFGIGGVAGTSYDEAVEALERARTRGRDTAEHWVGGHASFFEVPDPDTVLLLHMADDPSLGITFLDGGVIQFRIARAALAAADWRAIVAVAYSA
jgi:hypothetical protein